MSIDIIGSTSAKKGDSAGEWAKDFAIFLSDIVAMYRDVFEKTINEYCGCCAEPCVPDPDAKKKENSSCHVINLWKYVGDEVVLMAELSCQERHSSMHVLALAEAVRQLNSADYSYGKLRFRGTAWVAGFPVRNIELDLPCPESDDIRDFLGPSIDLGFRLSEFASENRLVVSPSLAYLIAIEQKNQHVPLYFGGMKKIRGFNDEQPLFWHSINKTLESGPIPPDALKDFIENKYTGNSSASSPFPFIPPPDDDRYDNAYSKAVKQQEKIQGSIYQKRKTSAATPDEDNASASSEDFDRVLKRTLTYAEEKGLSLSEAQGCQ